MKKDAEKKTISTPDPSSSSMIPQDLFESILKAIFDAAHFTMISTQVDGTITTFNLAAERSLGYSREEVIGQKQPTIFHDPAELQTRAQQLSEELGRPIANDLEVLTLHTQMGILEEREWSYVRKDGSRLPVALTVTSLQDRNGQMTGYLFTGKDITALRTARSVMMKAKEDAIRASQAKTAFLAHMNHELRTPLNAITGYTDLLSIKLKNINDPLIHEDLEKIRKASDELLDLINSALDIAKIEAGKMLINREWVDLAHLIHDIDILIRPLAAKRRNKISIDLSKSPPLISTDRDKLKQILINLISNASKFTSVGQIHIRMYLESNPTGNWHITEVSDTGVGIPKDKLTSIFEEFLQADKNVAPVYGGTGLGLSICKRFAEILGGKITVESEMNQGSKFRLYLPYQPFSVKNSNPESSDEKSN